MILDLGPWTVKVRYVAVGRAVAVPTSCNDAGAWAVRLSLSII